MTLPNRKTTMFARDKDFMDSIVELKDGAYYCKEPVNIEFPKWYQDKQMFDIADNTYLYGIFSIHCGNKYSVSVIPTVLVTAPILITEVERFGEPYIQLRYGKGDRIIESEKVIQHSFLSYNFFDADFMQGKVPWFLTYEDLCRILDNMVQYAASNLGANLVSNEVVVSFITRLLKNKGVFYRLKPGEEYTFVDLMDVRYSTLSTLSKLAGNYFDEGLVSALVHQEKTPNKLENHVRK